MASKKTTITPPTIAFGLWRIRHQNIDHGEWTTS
jgi:hypothetical protein